MIHMLFLLNGVLIKARSSLCFCILKHLSDCVAQSPYSRNLDHIVFLQSGCVSWAGNPHGPGWGEGECRWCLRCREARGSLANGAIHFQFKVRKQTGDMTQREDSCQNKGWKVPPERTQTCVRPQRNGEQQLSAARSSQAERRWTCRDRPSVIELLSTLS